MTAHGAETLADALRREEEALHRRFVWHTRPKRPLSLDEAIALSKRAEGKGA